ncbi:MAG: bifunctional methylenetetrahydrofolate dehydrogenase/methenyltetrahydrofolate cyclohydrolase FolD [Candidatus Pacebacteria bacterium]|nr:bifunctional methylenetetrahydrofolate dehydrogenase/methenyltetrahydrofolate cyclohydrolase FolD [Candidatus Paceibacterota bacterium]
MAAQIIDGKQVAAEINAETAAEVKRLKDAHGVQPGLTVVIIGDDPASKVYVSMKEKRARELGLASTILQLPVETSQQELLETIDRLNQTPEVHGILVQSPPPPHIDEHAVTLRMDPKKDVDCFHPYNVGKMLIGDRDGFFPCTPYGVMVLLDRYEINPEGKHAVIIGRSNIVGKPMMALLMQKAKGANATVTVCHSRTPNIPALCRQADIIVAAIGKREFVTADMVKEGAVVIDIGINRVDDPSRKRGYRLVGDVAFEEVKEKVSWITPVPGGVGPMTIAMLMQNAVKACTLQKGL